GYHRNLHSFPTRRSSDLAKICQEEKMWLHIDGAYGGAFAMLPEYKWVSEGWELADSIVINPHKTLFVPLDFSVLYVRDLERLRRDRKSTRLNSSHSQISY